MFKLSMMVQTQASGIASGITDILMADVIPVLHSFINVMIILAIARFQVDAIM